MIGTELTATQTHDAAERPERKTKSSTNAVKTALTGRAVLLPTDDATLYETHVRDFVNELRPVGIRESALAQSLADTAWRLDRIPALEMALYAHGRTAFAEQFEHEDPAVRSGLIEIHTFLAYERQFKNLHLQEARLRRHAEKDRAELRILQQERMRQAKEDLEAAAQLYLAAQRDKVIFDPSAFGFEFSTARIERFLAARAVKHEPERRAA